MKRALRITALIGFLLYTALPLAASAQLDQRCWKKPDCIAIRKDMYPSQSEQTYIDGFVVSEQSSKGCGTYRDEQNKEQEFGFCLPAGKTKTAIAFGGRREFEHIGDFIKTVYEYGVWASGVVAVAMILIAAVQWTVSGGNSALIESAKKRIGGAIMGLVLLALSYTILVTINPYLVNLRLPQIWLINTQGYAPEFCKNLQDEEKTALAFTKDSPLKDKKLKSKYEEVVKNNSYTLADKNKLNCGDQYFVENAGMQSCVGSACNTDSTCSPFDVKQNKKIPGFTCWFGNIILNMKLAFSWEALKKEIPLVGIKWDTLESGTWLDSSGTEVIGICKGPNSSKAKKRNAEDWNDGDELKVWEINEYPEEYIYQFKTILDFPDNEAPWSGWCDNTGEESIGFILLVELNKEWAVADPNVYIGYNGGKTIVGDSLEEIDWENNYIPKKELEKGIFLEVELSGADIKRLLK
ncbi:MAG: hypothetical protein HYY51_03845 [Candidatus Magasanikbacteria bacterium]|nr:hypothetical protein [Candidatus Magasanikbacteria bacterium]